MDLERKRVVTPRTGVISGSVWESRMKSDEVKGGIKVFNGENNSPEIVTEKIPINSELQLDKKLRPKQGLVIGESGGKRKTWKSDNSENPIQIAKQKLENKKSLGEKELNLSVDGIKKSPIQIKKTRSEVGKDLSLSVDGIEKSPIHRMRTRSLSQKGLNDSIDGIENNSIPMRKLKSEGNNGIERNSISISTVNGNAKTEELIKEIIDEKIPIEIKKSGSEESLEEMCVCEEKAITSNLVGDNVGYVKSLRELDDDDERESEEDWEEIMEEGEEIEKKGIDVKEMNVLEEKPNSPIKRKQSPLVVIEDKKNHQRNEKPMPISTIVRKQPPKVVNQPRIVSKPTISKPIPLADELPSHRVPKTHSKLQSFVDLVMWRDVSKSALVFGMGTFTILSSSYTRDLNTSFISVISYLGLVYLAAIFIFRSIISRGAMEMDDSDEEHVVGEEEAVWLLKLILPFINEFLLKVRALFSGDPATTMKLAVLLFVLARCGNSITIWKMAKLGFFGVFTVPKICSSYSSQLTAYGTFWIQRFRDAWESCSHKKAVAFGIFTVVWNLSSIVARIWAVFMLFVAFRYYQQSMMREEWVEEEATTSGGQNIWQGQKQRQGLGPTSTEISKQKKRSQH